MSLRKDKQRRVSKPFANSLDEIKLERIRRGVDKKFISDTRLTDGIVRDPDFGRIKERLIKMPRRDDLFGKMNRKGGLLDPITILVVIFLTVILLAGMVWLFGMITEALVGIPGGIGNVTFSGAAQDTFGKLNTATQSLRLVAMAIIFSLFMSFLLGNFLIKSHPAWLFAYVGVVLLSIILAVPISNAYETLVAAQIFDGTLSSFTVGTFVLLNLPVFITVVGMFGAIILFVNIIRDEGLGGAPQ